MSMILNVSIVLFVSAAVMCVAPIGYAVAKHERAREQIAPAIFIGCYLDLLLLYVMAVTQKEPWVAVVQQLFVVLAIVVAAYGIVKGVKSKKRHWVIVAVVCLGLMAAQLMIWK